VGFVGFLQITHIDIKDASPKWESPFRKRSFRLLYVTRFCGVSSSPRKEGSRCFRTIFAYFLCPDWFFNAYVQQIFRLAVSKCLVSTIGGIAQRFLMRYAFVSGLTTSGLQVAYRKISETAWLGVTSDQETQRKSNGSQKAFEGIFILSGFDQASAIWKYVSWSTGVAYCLLGLDAYDMLSRLKVSIKRWVSTARGQSPTSKSSIEAVAFSCIGVTQAWESRGSESWFRNRVNWYNVVTACLEAAKVPVLAPRSTPVVYVLAGCIFLSFWRSRCFHEYCDFSRKYLQSRRDAFPAPRNRWEHRLLKPPPAAQLVGLSNMVRWEAIMGNSRLVEWKSEKAVESGL
jgi:hypothetical protein